MGQEAETEALKSTVKALWEELKGASGNPRRYPGGKGYGTLPGWDAASLAYGL
jgi:hypothetical protein